MRKNKKRKILYIILSLVVTLALITTGVFFLLKNNRSYTFAEKKWISDNTNNLIDIYVQSDLPVFSNSGVGVFYDYISALEKDTNISFNIIYENNAKYSMTLKGDENNSITFYKDHYVVISQENRNIASLDTLRGANVGILNSDLSIVKQYLSDYSINYKGFETFDTLKTGFASQSIDVAIVPLYLAISDIIKENYIINYHIDGVNAYYSLNLSDNTELNGIMSKFYDRWSEKSIEKKNEHLADLYYSAKKFSELEKSEIINDDYIVGYLNNLPFEGIVNSTFTGLTSAYLNEFSNLSGATFKYVNYKSVDDLVLALNSGKVDIVANYYNIGATNYTNSTSFNTGDYVILTHANNPITLETLSTLSGSTVEMVSRMNLTNTIKSKGIFNVVEYKNAKELFKKIDKESIVIVDKEFYDYYKNGQFKNYAVKYSNSIDIKNNFLLKNGNTAFNKLFNFYLTLNSDDVMKSLSTQKLYSDARNNIILSFVLRNIVYIILGICALAFIIHKLNHRIRLSKKIKKEDKLLYIDVMTNLKNRNYLNDNIEYWSENKVYPQTILVVDLNKIKEINDKFGHEEGDKQIRMAANSLIKTQRENSEIMRTNGSEFMIYLVGYEEKMILSYIHKLTRELNSSLPYKEFGVALGYAMIESELSTIDDAINDATKRMRENKGVKSEKQA